MSIMELFFKSQPKVCKKKKLKKKLQDIPLNPFYDCKISVFRGQSLLSETEVRRYYQLPHISYLDVNFSKAKGRLFYDKTQLHQPAVIVLSGSDGRIEKAQNIAQLLASHGFTALAFAYFGLNDLTPYLERIPLEIVKEAINYLKASPYADSSRLGLYGRSKGAEFALLDLPNLIENHGMKHKLSAWNAIDEGQKKVSYPILFSHQNKDYQGEIPWVGANLYLENLLLKNYLKQELPNVWGFLSYIHLATYQYMLDLQIWTLPSAHEKQKIAVLH